MTYFELLNYCTHSSPGRMRIDERFFSLSLTMRKLRGERRGEKGSRWHSPRGNNFRLRPIATDTRERSFLLITCWTFPSRSNMRLLISWKVKYLWKARHVHSSSLYRSPCFLWFIAGWSILRDDEQSFFRSAFNNRIAKFIKQQESLGWIDQQCNVLAVSEISSRTSEADEAFRFEMKNARSSVMELTQKLIRENSFAIRSVELE